MSRHDQKPKARNLTCFNCLRGRCYKCVDVSRMVYTDEKVCQCKRINHDGEPNRQQILDPATGTVYTPGLTVTEDGKVEALRKHDYEPGESTHPMHTDPLCRICGTSSRSIFHNV